MRISVLSISIVMKLYVSGFIDCDLTSMIHIGWRAYVDEYSIKVGHSLYRLHLKVGE